MFGKLSLFDKAPTWDTIKHEIMSRIIELRVKIDINILYNINHGLWVVIRQDIRCVGSDADEQKQLNEGGNIYLKIFCCLIFI